MAYRHTAADSQTHVSNWSMCCLVPLFHLKFALVRLTQQLLLSLGDCAVFCPTARVNYVMNTEHVRMCVHVCLWAEGSGERG